MLENKTQANTKEGKVLSLDAFRRKKSLGDGHRSPQQHGSEHKHLDDIIKTTDQGDHAKQVLARMERIKTTIQKINEVMEELKTISRKKDRPS